MKEITLEELLEAGCHFGHQVIRSNPKARDFVFEARDNIQIIDLGKTKEGLEDAVRFVKEVSTKGGSMLVVGTKRQAQGIVADAVKKAKNNLENGGDISFINSRWIGGVLTNFSEISKNLKKLKDLEESLKDEEKRAKYTKKEIGEWEKEKQRLERLYGGISDLKKIPDILFIIDSNLEEIAVREARRTGLPTVAIVDTNADPLIIDYPIPANDDAVGSIELILSYILEAWTEGKKSESKMENSELKTEKKAESEKLKAKNETDGAKKTSKKEAKETKTAKPKAEKPKEKKTEVKKKSKAKAKK